MTLSGHQDDSTSLSTTAPDEDKHMKSVIDVNDDVDESITPLLGHQDIDKSGSSVMNEVKLMIIYDQMLDVDDDGLVWGSLMNNNYDVSAVDTVNHQTRVPAWCEVMNFLCVIFHTYSQHKFLTRKDSISAYAPRTAPPLEISSTESSFSFDPPASPRSARIAEKSPIKFTFDGNFDDDATLHATSLNKENILRRMSHDVSNSNKRKPAMNGNANRLKGLTTAINGKDASLSELKRLSSTRKMSSVSQSSTSTGTSSELTTFPFDREAIDYDRIQRECFAVEEEFDESFKPQHRHSVFHYDYDTDSPSYEALDQKVPPEGIFQQYAYLSQLERDKLTAKTSPLSEMKTLKIDQNGAASRKSSQTSMFINDPLPDLKIDFFSNASSSMRKKRIAGKSKSASTSPRALDSGKKRDRAELGDDEDDDDVGNNNEVFAGENADAAAALARCQKNSTLATSSFSNKSSSSINVVSNPMSTAVVTTPRATIVVQQVNEKRKLSYV